MYMNNTMLVNIIMVDGFGEWWSSLNTHNPREGLGSSACREDYLENI